MGHFDINAEKGGRDARRVPQTDHGEASAAGRRQDVGYARVGRSAGGSWNSIRYDLYGETTGNRGTVVGATATIQSV